MPFSAMEHGLGFLAAGALLLAMGTLASLLRQLPLSPAMFYLPIGYLLGPSGAGMLALDPLKDGAVLMRLAEGGLLLSLFTVGLQLRVPLRDRLWLLPLRLGLSGMVLTVALLAPLCWLLPEMNLGWAILLAAILAPTDPVLASDVQVHSSGDRDRIRFALTAEGGLNDGTAFPFVMLGLALLGAADARGYAGPFALVLALWGALAGLAGGFALGWLVGRLWVNLRGRYRMALGMEEFFTLGLIALAYGAALQLGGLGFVAVFAAGLAVRHIEFTSSGMHSNPGEVIGALSAGAGAEVATHPRSASAYMTETVLGFNRQLEHIAELVLVLLVGVLLSGCGLSLEGILVALLLLLVVRPLAVLLALRGSRTSRLQRGLAAWFGIRGAGTLYYLLFALQSGIDWQVQEAQRMSSLVLTVVALSVLLHGVSATPLMELYAEHRRRRP